MTLAQRTHRSRGCGRGPAASIGIGVAAGLTTAAGLLFGRKVATISKVGKGHPVKHRALDLAAGALQPKYPLDAMSTYLNGFHMYADDMGSGRWRPRTSASISSTTCTSA
ncbi:hypothetical protein [Streptomyces sp. x-45]|uniref:hypothetical protein n=1 Tax=Streptomyces sp. x-45 TaxID=2789281 RepID=UPI00397FAC23